MAVGTPPRPTYFTLRTLVAFAIAYAIAALGAVLGFVLPSVPWLALGLWLAASLTVLLIDRTVGERMPRAGQEVRENLGAIFQGSPAALAVIGVMAVAALLVALFARW
jgi:uncharacterized membrane protein